MEKSDLIIAMSKDHQEFIKKNFDIEVPLFKEVCKGKKESLKDIWEVIPDWRDNPRAKNEYMIKTVDYIHGCMPDLIKKMDRFMN